LLNDHKFEFNLHQLNEAKRLIDEETKQYEDITFDDFYK